MEDTSERKLVIEILDVRQFCKEAKEFQKHQYHLSFGGGRVRPKKAVLKFLWAKLPYT